MVRFINYKGSPLYFLADDAGMVWMGGWRSEEVANERLKQAEGCDWDSNHMDCEVDVDMFDGNGVMIVEEDEDEEHLCRDAIEQSISIDASILVPFGEGRYEFFLAECDDDCNPDDFEILGVKFTRFWGTTEDGQRWTIDLIRNTDQATPC